jgi:signal transduction histidine kinase
MIARRVLVAFLLVTVPGTLLLGAVTYFSLRRLRSINDELGKVSRALDATRSLLVAVTQAEAPLREQLGQATRGHEQEFNRVMERVEEQMRSCGSTGCHASEREPAAMAATLTPLLDQLRAESRLVFGARSGLAPGPRAAAQERVETLVREASQGLGRMSIALSRRQAVLADEAAAVGRLAMLHTALLTSVIVTLAAVVALVLAARISRPLAALRTGTRRIMAGDWECQVAVTDRGELGELARSFNAMVAELRAQRERLDEANRTLEERVRERTEELARKDKALQQAERLAGLGLLAAGIAHEINNPLTGIVMNANLLLEEVGEASPLAADLRKIDQDAARCRRIVDDLRAFARWRELVPAASSVSEVVEQALRATQHELAQRAVALDIDVPAELPDIVWDADRMVQVLTNLLANAGQASDPGGRLTIACRRNDGWLRLEVRDQGTGIAADDLPHIFDPFFTTKRDGTGLGLSICHGIVTQHGGRLEVASKARGTGTVDSGTTVAVMVPYRESAT